MIAFVYVITNVKASVRQMTYGCQNTPRVWFNSVWIQTAGLNRSVVEWKLLYIHLKVFYRFKKMDHKNLKLKTIIYDRFCLLF